MFKLDFVIAGFQKCGTTWLEKNINNVPGVYTPERQLGISYKGVSNDYKELLEMSNFYDTDQSVKGLKNTEFLFDRYATDVFSILIKQNPNLKVIYIMRDPVDRFFSAILHSMRVGEIKMVSDADTFAQQCLHNQDELFFERGVYVNMIRKLEEIMPKDNILPLIFERDVVYNPLSGMDKVTSFLGVSLPGGFTPTREINNLRLSKIASLISFYFYKWPYVNGVIRKVDRTLDFPAWKHTFNNKIKDDARCEYQPFNEELFNYIGCEIKEWVT